MKNMTIELEAALQAAKLAEMKIMAYYASMAPVPDAQANITTQADMESQDIILRHLYQLFPGDGFLGEESTDYYLQLPHKGKRLWIVDPIDGTRGFAKKNGEFCIMLALVEDYQVQIGVVLDPTRRRLTFAVRDKGCWKKDGSNPAILCSVTKNNLPSRLVLARSHPRIPGKLEGKALILAPEKMLETYSAGLKLASVARGEADAYTNDYPTYHDWDICAGHILVEEAKGTLTNLCGETILYGKAGYQKKGFLASNGLLHKALLSKIQG